MASSGPLRPAPTRVMVWRLRFMRRPPSAYPQRGLASSLGQQRSPLPQFGKEFLVQRELEIGRPRASSGAHAHSDGALDKLDVSQPQTDDKFVKLREPLAHVNP